MNKLNRLLALVLALVMACGLCLGAVAETTAPRGEGILVYSTATFGQKFSPFFATTAYDMEVVDLTQALLLQADRGGAIINRASTARPLATTAPIMNTRAWATSKSSRTTTAAWITT